MSIVSLNTAYLPPVSWWACSLFGERLMIDTEEKYQKQSFRNRANILTANGLHHISIPVKQGANQSATGEVLIDNSQKWQNIHWRTLCASYNHSPYFQYIKPDLEPLLFQPCERLVDLNLAFVSYFIKIMKLPLRFADRLSENKHSEEFIDYRNLGKKSVWRDNFQYPTYQQVFGQQFEHDLSIIDLFSNVGTESRLYLQNVAASFETHQ